MYFSNTFRGVVIFLVFFGFIAYPYVAYGGSVGNHMEHGIFVEASYPDYVAPDEDFAIRITLYNNNYYAMDELTILTNTDPFAIKPVAEHSITFEQIGPNSQLGEMIYFKVLQNATLGSNFINFVYENNDDNNPVQKSFRIPLLIKEDFFSCLEQFFNFTFY